MHLTANDRQTLLDLQSHRLIHRGMSADLIAERWGLTRTAALGRLVRLRDKGLVENGEAWEGMWSPTDKGMAVSIETCEHWTD